ncbi:uncharacterized protein SCHCODRAFT_01088735 [Schizophyllum commune H4-8]|nr:uncharacterized protein SCHCODRAFT_01088735 [Schizophyllum commune H4-8]KAI5894717.1 hypothetical protein SCHCODRAFT_01088735 [Schizophyllum commune H4-8]
MTAHEVHAAPRFSKRALHFRRLLLTRGLHAYRRSESSPKRPPEQPAHTVVHWMYRDRARWREEVGEARETARWTVNHVGALERRMVTLEEHLVGQRCVNPFDDHPFITAKRNTTHGEDDMTLSPTVASP